MFTSPEFIQNSDISRLTNTNYSLVCSGGCYSASFDNRKSNGDYTADAVGETFVVSEGGAFAYVGNSRYGWYEPGTIIGPNDRYGRALFQTLMDLSQENQTTNLGKALQFAKEDLLFEHHYLHLWTYYTLNLLGDPEVQIEMKRTVPLARFSMPIDSGIYKLFPSTYGDNVIINGTACQGFDPGSTFDHYTIEYGEGMTPTTWSSNEITLINDGKNEVVEGILAKVDPSQLNNGPYIFRLSVYDSNGIISQDWNVVMIANASTVYNKNNGKTYCSIQTAVDNADNYDTIYIDSREYFEYVSIDKPIVLIGKSKNNVIIDGCAIRSVIEIFANGTTISDVTAQNSGMLQSFDYAFSGINVLSDKNIVLNNNLYINDHCGLFLNEASHNLIINNNVEGNDFYGIKLKDSTENHLVGNFVTNQRFGIRFDGSDNNSIYKNKLVNNTAGLQLMRSNNNSVFKNRAYRNLQGGIQLFSISCNNKISNNSIYGNAKGMTFEYFSSNNTIFHNVFMNNEDGNAYDECNNTWDAGYPVGGNYWDDYNGTDEDGDGFGDSPYNITGGDNQDRYPFMKPNPWIQSLAITKF